MSNRILSLVFIFLFTYSVSSYAEIKSQWRGPNRDGVYPETNLLKQWPKDGPELLWAVDGIGIGYSSAAVTSDRVYKKKWTFEKAVTLIVDEKGKHFDPLIVDAFIDSIDKIKEIYMRIQDDW